MARHATPQNPTARRALVALATAGVTLCAGAATAFADTDPGLTAAVGHVAGPVTDLKPNPLAGTGVDPLGNGLGAQVADFRPLATQALTGPVAQAQSIGGVPVVGRAAGLLGNG
jgi:hypothetical protein